MSVVEARHAGFFQKTSFIAELGIQLEKLESETHIYFQIFQEISLLLSVIRLRFLARLEAPSLGGFSPFDLPIVPA